MYQALFRVFFRRLDAEFAHHLGASIIRLIGLLPPPKHPRAIEIAGMKFVNRVGMAAGFDKNARLVRGLYRLGFGHVEVGTITPLPQPGNAKPRLFRIPQLRALINRMGFNNDGAAVVARRLKALRASGTDLPIIGVNIGKNKLTDPAQAAEDYAACARQLAGYADYLVVNVSSPNTPGLRDLQQVDSLLPILQSVKEHSGKTPILVKISPDSADQDLLEVANLVNRLELAGVIATNTTINRPVEQSTVLSEIGGLSGLPLAERSKEILILLRGALPERVIISVGGIETAADVKERLKLGADLVQGYTGFVYHGPAWAKQLTKDA